MKTNLMKVLVVVVISIISRDLYESGFLIGAWNHHIPFLLGGTAYALMSLFDPKEDKTKEKDNE